MRDAVNSNLMTVLPQLLNLLVVGVLMRGKESSANWAAVGILSVGCEDLILIELPVLDVDGIIESHDDHLWCLDWFQVARDERCVFRAKAFW